MSTDLATRRNQSTAAGVSMIVSGVLTATASFGIVATWGWICVGLPWLVPMAVGVGEVVVGASIIGGTPRPSVKTVSTAGILAALVSFNLVGVLLEIVAQILLGKASEPERY
jgi:hypothetical protein